jgi:Bacterial Ig-like domain (group 2)
MTSRSSIHRSAAKSVALATFAVLAVAMFACSDPAAPRPSGAAVRISSLSNSVFEGDVVRLTAVVLDDSGAEVAGAPVTWTASDTTLAKDAGGGSFALLRPGTTRITASSGAVSGTYDLVIGRLVVTRVDLTPPTLSLGRGDRVQVSARVVGPGDRPITNSIVTYTSDDPRVAIIGSPDNVVGAPGFLIAVGPGSTTIRATVDGVSGTAQIGVVIADTTFALTQYDGSPLPVLIARDSVLFNGVKELAEVYAESGTMVLSGLAQLRYQLDVRFSQYHVIHTGNTVQRELRFQSREVDHGIVSVAANGSLAMTSELVSPLAHTAALEPDGFLVHFRIAGDDGSVDLKYRRQTP